MGPLYPTLFQDYLSASQSADVVIAAGTALGAYDCAEELGIPLICALLQPFPPTRAFPSFFLPPAPPPVGVLLPVHQLDLFVRPAPRQPVGQALHRARVVPVLAGAELLVSPQR
jgi:hypothetical protein